MLIDATNLAIITHLKDGRASFKKIAEDLSLAEGTVRTRVKKLMDEGVLSISGLVNPEALPEQQIVMVGVRVKGMDLVKKGVESSWSVSGDRTMVALTMTFASEPMAKTMSFQREYAEPYDWVAQQFKDWAFTLTTSILYYNDYDSIDEDTRNLYRKAMAAFGGIAPSYHIELLDKPTIYWDFHSLLLGIQMMFSFMLVDGDQPLRLCKHCQKVFLGSRSNAAFCSPRCKNQYNVYKSRGKQKCWILTSPVC